MSNSNPEKNHPYINNLRTYGKSRAVLSETDFSLFDTSPQKPVEPETVAEYSIVGQNPQNDIITILNLGKDKSVTYQLALGDGVPTTILTTELTDEGKPQYGEKFLTNDTLKLLVELFPHYAPYLTEVNEV